MAPSNGSPLLGAGPEALGLAALGLGDVAPPQAAKRIADVANNASSDHLGDRDMLLLLRSP
jgi:hypothetical protein